MQVHQTALVALDFARVQKTLGKSDGEANVRRAATPLPCRPQPVTLLLLRVRRVLLLLLLLMMVLVLVRDGRQRRVAAAHRNVALGACLRYRVHGASAGDGIREGGLA